MNLNRREDRNLENTLKSIERQKRTSISLIDCDIKKFEQDNDLIRQEAIKLVDNQEKLNLLTETLNLNYLIDKNNNFINQLSSQTFELKNSGSVLITSDENQPVNLTQDDQNPPKIVSNEKPAVLLRKNLSANGRLGSANSTKSAAKTQNRTSSAENLKEISHDLLDLADQNQQPYTPRVEFNLNTSNQSINSTPRGPVITRPESTLSLLTIEKNFNNSVSLQPSKININRNVIWLPPRTSADHSTKKAKLVSKDASNSMPVKEKLRASKKFAKKSHSISDPVFSKSKPTNVLPAIAVNEIVSSSKSSQNITSDKQTSTPYKLSYRTPKQPSTNDIRLAKSERIITNVTKLPITAKMEKEVYTIPLAVTNLQINDEMLQNENKLNTLRMNASLPIIVKK